MSSPNLESPSEGFQNQQDDEATTCGSENNHTLSCCTHSARDSPPLPDMADPFEVRMRFTSQLQHLNASVTSSQKAAQYALKYKDMDEDLHSCILEQLEKNSMNNRANIMYFIEHLADMAAREGHHDYVRMMQRDILRVVDAVAPEDGSGAANVKVVRKVLQGLQAKSFLLPETVAEIEDCLKERDTLPSDIMLSSPPGPADHDVAMSGTSPHPQLPSRSGSSSSKIATAPARLDKKQIEQRIEEDRERHKRLREHQWAIPSSKTAASGSGMAGGAAAVEDEDEAEFLQLLEETSSVGSDDYRLFEEEALERKQCALEHAEEMEARFASQGE